MALYNYRPLNIEAGEIRLLDILPGSGEDPLRARFLDAHVPIPDEPMQTYIDDPEVAKLQSTMPADWEAARTVGGQLIFTFKGNESTSWSHPNPEYALTPEPVPTNRKVLPKDIPSYEALSYCWGLAEPSELLTIDLDSELGFTQRGVLSIIPNLASALRHLRYPSSARRMWIDALCINQTDIIERGRHVARMGTIYEFASRVLIWLGPEADNSSVAMEQFQKLGNQVETVEGKLLPSPGSAHPEWMKSYDVNREIFNSFKALLSRQYFSRLWIWQEVILANLKTSVVQCGNKSIPWYTLQRGIKVLYETTLSDPEMRQELAALGSPHIQNVALKWTLHWSGIDRLIWGTSSSGCTDQRDRVYALLGLCDPKLAAQIRPDYSLTISEVYRDMALAFLNENRNLLLLKYCDLATRSINPPTWVPDLANPASRPVQFNYASGEAQAIFTRKDENVLGVTGVQVARVIATSEKNLDGNPLSLVSAYRMVKDWYDIAANHDTESFEGTFFMSISNGRVTEKESGEKDSAKEYAAELKEFRSREDSLTEANLADSKLLHSLYRNEKCTFFYSDKGYMGLGPIGTQPGDVVSVLLGCLAPIILRPSQEDKDGFKVVGRAYADGLMDAQGVLGPVERPWKAMVQRWTPKGDIWIYKNEETGEVAAEDPRLGPLPDSWDSVEDGKFRHQKTGETSEMDPRWLWENLQKRNNNWRELRLI